MHAHRSGVTLTGALLVGLVVLVAGAPGGPARAESRPATSARAGTTAGVSTAVWEPSATPLLGRTLVTWVSDGSAGAVEVDRSADGGPWVPVADLPGDATSWVDDAVTTGVTSTYRLVVSSPSGAAQTTGSSAPVVGASEELLLTAGDTPDLLSAAVGDGTPLPWATGQALGAVAVSPDGRSVAYEVRDPALGRTSLWVRGTAPAGAAARRLVDDPAADELDPSWAPDGSRVCYTRDAHQGGVALWCVPTGSGTAAPLPGGGGAGHPTFLPDGRSVVAVDEVAGGLLRIGADGARVALGGSEGADSPAVSARGDLVAFGAVASDGFAEVRTLPVAGGRVTTRLRADALDQTFGAPAWAPDGAALAVPTHRAGASDAVALWRADAVGGAGSTSTVAPAAGRAILSLAWRRADLRAPTVSFPKAPSRTSGSVSLPVRVVDDSVPVAGLSVVCTVDGVAVPRCDGGYRGKVGTGTHTLRVTATDPFGRVGSAGHTWTADATGPVVSVSPLPAVLLGTTLRLTYAATDASGVTGYDIRRRYARWSSSGFTAYAQPWAWTGTTARSISVPLSLGYEYCFSVRARDAFGNVSPWSTERCTMRPLDDRSLAAGAGWSRFSYASAYSATLSRSTTAGASLTRSGAYVRHVVLVATTCPKCGSLDVYVGRKRIGTIGLYSSTTRTQQLRSVSATSLRSGTITLRARTSGRLVIVDGLGIRKT